jgi:hypothetical protein
MMEPAHYAGLLRPSGARPTPGPPRLDPDYPLAPDVAVRDPGVSSATAEETPP